MTPTSWLEISLTVDGELAEAVAEVLARFIPEGVVVESTAVANPLDPIQGHSVGPLRVYGYLPVNEQLESLRNQIEEALWHLGQIQPLPAAQFRPIQHTNWAEAWKKHYQPIAIGKTLMIIPAWLENPSRQRIPIRIDPGMAFGTGTHPTTQLCLELLEDTLHQMHDASASFAQVAVIDIGCGSGILSIAALKLGVRHALGVDIDTDAIRASQENALTNQVAQNFELGVGSLEDVRRGKFTICQADIVFANILAPVIIRLFDEDLGDVLAPDGVMILSGILEEQEPNVRSAYERHGFTLVEKRRINDWVAFAIRKRGG